MSAHRSVYRKNVKVAERKGAGGWLAERLSSLVLVPLTLWALWSAAMIAGTGYEGALDNYEQLKEAGVAMIGYGALITAVINFFIVAFALFMLVRSVNKITEDMQRKAAATEDSSTNADVPTNPELDVLKKILAELRKDGGAALGQGPASKG